MVSAMPRPDTQTIRELLERHEQPLVRYVLSLTGDLETARDIVQDTFLKLIRRENLGEDHAAPWLFAVCRNAAIDAGRAQARSCALHQRLPEPVSARSPASEVSAKDDRRLLLELLAELPPEKREVLGLRLDAQLSYREIARVTGHSVSYVGVLIHESVQSLRVRWHQLAPL